MPTRAPIKYVLGWDEADQRQIVVQVIREMSLTEVARDFAEAKKRNATLLSALSDDFPFGNCELDPTNGGW